MSLKFIHFSDSHLGFIDYTSDELSVQKARENDAYKTVAAVIDHAIATKPDFVLHTGDFFHRPSPYNKALVEAATQLKRLGDAGIPFYMIAGNHDLPKSDDTQAIHPIFDLLAEGKIFFDQKYSVLDCGDFILHALPHINFSDKHLEEIEKISVTDRSKPNILMMHLSMPLSVYKEEEPGGGVFPAEKLGILAEFDYVALGHWHRFNHIKKYGSVCYSGSTERINAGEADHDKGFVEVTIDSGKTNINFVKLETRRYLTIMVNECSTKTREEIIEEITNAINGDDLSEAVVKVILDGLTDNQSFEFMLDNVVELTGKCLVLKLIKRKKGEEPVEYETGSESLFDRLLGDIRKSFKDDDDFNKFKLEATELFEEFLGDSDNAN